MFKDHTDNVFSAHTPYKKVQNQKKHKNVSFSPPETQRHSIRHLYTI